MTAIWLRINAGLLLLVLAALIAMIGVLAARVEGGPLDPNTAPQSTDSVRLPGTAIAAPTTISSPGHYYLTRNITIAGAQTAITISASDVTLDLGGFTIRGDDTLSSFAIVVTGPPGTHSRIAISNGHVVDVHQGVIVLNGRDVRVDNVHAFSNERGFQLGDSSAISNCTSNHNSQYGIIVSGSRSSVSNCNVIGNGHDGVFLSGQNNSVMNSRAIFNAVSNLSGEADIRVTNSSVVSGNVTGHPHAGPNIMIEGLDNEVFDNVCASGNLLDVGAGNATAPPDHLNIEC